jgi:hypothetical protein
MAGLDGDLRDARPHRAQTDHADATNHRRDANRGRNWSLRPSSRYMTRQLLIALVLMGLVVLALGGAVAQLARGRTPALLGRRNPAFV